MECETFGQRDAVGGVHGGDQNQVERKQELKAQDESPLASRWALWGRAAPLGTAWPSPSSSETP